MDILQSAPAYLPHLIITYFVWLTYSYTLKCGAVSDDIAGLLEYDGKLQGFEYGMLWRWVRYHIVGGNYPSKNKDNAGNTIPCGKDMPRHHFLSIILFNITCLVTYQALTPIVGPTVSLLSILLLIVHPCTTQGVAWVSGLAYPLSLFWISLTILLMQFFYANQSLNNAIWVIPAFCIIQFFAIHAIFATTAMTWSILLLLGYWQFAILAFIISSVMCFDQIRKTVKLRVDEFKKQNMEKSTILNWRKPIVTLKTFAYYIKHSLFPRRMGLYHEWNFHYTHNTERFDKLAFFGLISLLTLTCIFFKTDCVSIKFGILWYIAFSIGFWNIITAQQFVTERYIMVANLGLTILLSYFLTNTLWLYTFILGAYLVRTWVHLPTYDNELRFYLSNNWNFQKSEVALGNLGVTYARIGMPDSAKDTWLVASSINPDYDVPWVNLFYQFRTNAMVMINNGDYIGGIKKMQEAVPYIEKALSASVCHFKDKWETEKAEVRKLISNPHLILQDELARLLTLKESLLSELSRTKDQQRVNDISISLNNNEKQMDNLVSFFTHNKFIATNPAPFNKYYADRELSKIGGVKWKK